MAGLRSLLFGILGKRMEIGAVILIEDLGHGGVLKLCGRLVAFEDVENEGLQEIDLFFEVLMVLYIRDPERIHGDRVLFGVGYVCSVVIAADALVRVARVNHHHICILFQQLTDYAVHVELRSILITNKLCVVWHNCFWLEKSNE